MPWYENRNGERLWYEDRGEGTPIVLVHGWCMSSAVWKYQFDVLAVPAPAQTGHFRLIAPDLRGHGLSCGIKSGLDFDRFAEDLEDLLVCLELKDVILAGWSMGAQVALQASAALSGRLAGMVLVSATPCFTASDDFPYGLAGKDVAGMRLKVLRNRQRALEGFSARMFAEGELECLSSPAEIAGLLSVIPVPDTDVMVGALDALAAADMRGLLGDITVPVLIVNGALDLVCLPQASDYLHDHIPGARQVVFISAGHAPFLTYSEKFNEEIIRFARSACEQDV